MKMCWITTNKENIIIRTADKDIDVFKVCLKEYDSDVGVYDSVYFKHEYRIGEHYHSTLDEPHKLDCCYCINVGLHSYDSAMAKCTKTDTGIRVRSNEGEFIDVITGDLVRELVIILNCVIPKGSTYYINERGECVSSELIVKSVDNYINA